MHFLREVEFPNERTKCQQKALPVFFCAEPHIINKSVTTSELVLRTFQHCHICFNNFVQGTL